MTNMKRLECVLWLGLVVGGATVTLAQPSPSPRPSSVGNNPSQDATTLIEYSTFLREEEKAHREYLEKLYTTTSVVLGVLVTIGVGLIGFFQFKTKKDVTDAVDAQFRSTVEKELHLSIEQFRKQLTASMEEINSDINARIDLIVASETQRFQELLFAAVPSKVELADSGEAQAAVGQTQSVVDSALSDDEKAILNLMDQSKYSFRSFMGIAAEAASGNKIEAEKVLPAVENLTRRGLLGRTLGKRGGERWFITEAGRKYLKSKGTA